MADAGLTLILPGYAALFSQQLNRNAMPAGLSRLVATGRFDAETVSFERILLRLFAADAGEQQDLPLAQLRLPEITSLCADPCYLHPDRDQLRVFHNGLALSEEEAAAIVEAIKPLLAEMGAQLHMLTPLQWQLELPQLPEVQFTALPELEGQAVTSHLPSGRQAGEWIRLWNEMQMLLFDLPLNREREAAGKLPVNSLWFWGAAPLPAQWRRWDRVCSRDPVVKRLAQLSRSPQQAECIPLQPPSADTLIVADALDWQGPWQQQLQAQQQQLWQPLWQLLKRRKLKQLTLLIPGWGRYLIKSPKWWQLWT